MSVVMKKGSTKSRGDRISDLPDELVSLILGMLPTKDAAVTTFISNKFMSAFSVLSNLDLDDSPISHCLQTPILVERSPIFKEFVDYVLQSCQSQQLDRFTLHFGRFCGDQKRYLNYQDVPCKGWCYPYLEPARLYAWISYPLARGVRELDLCINVEKYQAVHMLPSFIFICETLETLKLDSNLDLGIHDVKAFPIRLPHLKLLHLRSLLITKDEFVTKLVKFCPLLEDLLMDCWWDYGDVFVISSSSLLKLDLCFNKCYLGKNSKNVTIQTPNLQSFKYQDNLAEHYIIPSMAALVQAEITIFAELLDGNSYWSLCSLLKSCSTASHLSLLYSAPQCLDQVELRKHLPVFANLNHLELGASDYTYWNKVLVQILEYTPSLKTLVFPEGLGYLYRDSFEAERGQLDREQSELEFQFWRTAQAIPSCFKSHLNKIVIKAINGDVRELALVAFLLRKALVLESLVISLSDEIEELKMDQDLLQSVLEELPRASRICSIRVFFPL